MCDNMAGAVALMELTIDAASHTLLSNTSRIPCYRKEKKSCISNNCDWWRIGSGCRNMCNQFADSQCRKKAIQ